MPNPCRRGSVARQKPNLMINPAERGLKVRSKYEIGLSPLSGIAVQIRSDWLQDYFLARDRRIQRLKDPATRIPLSHFLR